MKLTVLADNTTLIERYFLGEPGLSLFLEADGSRILFDAGYSDVFLRNAERLRIDLSNLDHVALSHGHLDHIWGLEHLLRRLTEDACEDRPVARPVLTAHPDALSRRGMGRVPAIGNHLSPAVLADFFTLRLSKAPVALTERLIFLGEIPRHFDFESASSPGDPLRHADHDLPAPGQAAAPGLPDTLADDTALAYASPAGLVILVGCSHAGICNIVRHARQVCGETRIRDIVGGLHLLCAPAARLEATGRCLAEFAPAAVHPCHCTDLAAKIALSRFVPVLETGSGLVLDYP
ncbi:MBL fold metallo-hydrolase [Desulfovibrio sulfodismutans]|uniref:MBL fold metallo-hydrolase n=1 Tax=Desulfolutivibrio sulfodismutans TaxID=63561 RepID=A0A7K3NK09_9BACT|nr:MBL fold metallo-hydrolase [Desulfolutivibrio sulfodismutans]NDY56522.1 MBL fold metallo-hydrolase [Desulfolutivibrio sulfodismutans]QLA12612.1 MBL fold metallo-hydrolase [Desulfolutivibrio sulfodismutans DSM 3696]